MVSEILDKNKQKLPSWSRKPRNLIIAAAVIIAVIIIGLLAFNSRGSESTENKPTVKINKSYEIIARTKDKQKTTGRFTMTVTNAQFADSILVQGKRARPVKGKIFLVINVEIENNHKVQLYAFPVDLFRLIRSDGKRFAPSVHQGTVLVRPQATKKNNVAFVVLPSDKKFKIEVGDVNKPTETLEITFK